MYTYEPRGEKWTKKKVKKKKQEKNDVYRLWNRSAESREEFPNN